MNTILPLCPFPMRYGPARKEAEFSSLWTWAGPVALLETVECGRSNGVPGQNWACEVPGMLPLFNSLSWPPCMQGCTALLHVEKHTIRLVSLLQLTTSQLPKSLPGKLVVDAWWAQATKRTVNWVQPKKLTHKIINEVTKLRGSFTYQQASSLCIPQKIKSYSSSTKTPRQALRNSYEVNYSYQITMKCSTHLSLGSKPEDSSSPFSVS